MLLAALEDDGATEAADELAGVDDLPPPPLPPPPPQATRPMMQVLSRLVFRLINGILLLGLVMAVSLILSIVIVQHLWVLLPRES
jgi:hypothetical protein